MSQIQKLKPFKKYMCCVIRSKDGSETRGVLATDSRGILEPLPPSMYSMAVALYEMKEEEQDEKES
jgi:hypothetical protein